MADKKIGLRRSNRARKSSRRNENLESEILNTFTGKSLIFSASTDEIVPTMKPQDGDDVASVETLPASTAKVYKCRANSKVKLHDVDSREKCAMKPNKIDATPAVKESGHTVASLETPSTSTAKNGNCRAESTVKPHDTDDILPINCGGGLKASATNTQCRYEVDVSEMIERGTINVDHFESYLRERFKDNGTINNLAKNVTVKKKQFKVVVESKIFFKKSVVKYHAKKFLKMKKLRHWVKVAGKNKNSYRFMYYTP